MLQCRMLTVGHRKFAVSTTSRHGKRFSGSCGRLSTGSAFRDDSVEVSSLRSRGWCGRVNVEQGNGGDSMDTCGRLGGGSEEMAEAGVRSGDRCDGTAEEGPVAGECSAADLDAVRSSDAWAQDRLSYKEMMERWEFLKRLPHKLQRDIGYIIVGPSLLSSSEELPTVSASMLGGSSSQWPITKSWLQQLSIPAVEAWFASRRSSQRLGDYFALCIEYVLRHSPHVEVQQLLTSQQVLQRVTEPVPNSRALKALESKLLAQKTSSWYMTPMLVEPVLDDKPHIPLSPRVGPLQDEQQQVPSEYRPTTVDESIQILEAMDLTDKNLGVVGGTLQDTMGKRKRKLLKKLERIRLRKGKTTTVGEFDFLFETPAHDNSKGKEFHHWEVSVKYLLYAGPWEVFGVRSPMHAAWRNPDTEDSDLKLNPLSPEYLDTESCEGAISVPPMHDSESIDDGGSEGTRTTTADVCSGPNSSRAEEKNCLVIAGKDDQDLFVENLGEDCWTTQQHPREVDNFLGCYLGPHVGETLLDRKARLRNQLALSANPYAALMLRDLYINKGINEIAEQDRTKGLTSISAASTQLLEPSTAMKDGVSTTVSRDRQGALEEDSHGVSNKGGTEDLVVVPSALLNGYLFYEYKLWRFLERSSNRNVAEASSEPGEGSSASGYPIKVTSQNHDTSNENEDEMTCQSGKVNGLEIQASQLTEKACLNMNHWMGWWTRDIMEFADLPVHQYSKWYIVPKLEWLSPVVIPQSDADRCARVLSLSDFVVTAAKVAEEAARLLMPRKRRFLVAEVRWTSDWEPCRESEEKRAAMGAWLEVSRGFVVEDTWPVSKMYRPHGYVVSWSPSLQGRHVNVSEM